MSDKHPVVQIRNYQLINISIDFETCYSKNYMSFHKIEYRFFFNLTHFISIDFIQQENF